MEAYSNEINQGESPVNHGVSTKVDDPKLPSVDESQTAAKTSPVTSSWTKFQILSTFSLGIVTMLLLVIQLGRVQKGLDQTRAAVLQQEKTVGIVNRPYVNLYNGSFGYSEGQHVLSPTISFVNRGSSPAINGILSDTFVVMKNGVSVPLPYTLHPTSWALIGAGENVGFNLFGNNLIPFDPENETAMMYGTFRYGDGWGKHHAIDFCRTNSINIANGFGTCSTPDRQYEE
jgi:hypothetical protein